MKTGLKRLLGMISAACVVVVVALVYVFAISEAAHQVESEPDGARRQPVASDAMPEHAGDEEPANLPASAQFLTVDEDDKSIANGSSAATSNDTDGEPQERLTSAAQSEVATPRSTPRLSAQEVFDAASSAVVRIEVRGEDFSIVGQGSGILISPDGLIATNYHVISGAFFAFALRDNGIRYPIIGLAGFDKDADLAIVEIQGQGFPHLELSSRALPTIGARVYTIGNPRGLTNTISEGLVSGLRKEDDNLTLIQTSAPISPGSSGGALLDEKGRLVGITTSGLTGGGDLNFAVPIARVVSLVRNRTELQPLIAAAVSLSPAETGAFDAVWNAFEREDYGAALGLLGKVPGSQKNSELYWFALGAVQSRLGNHELALIAYKKVFELQPKNAVAQCNVGISHFNLGQYDLAKVAYEHAIILQPDATFAYLALAEFYTETGNLRAALSAYGAVEALRPTDLKSAMQLAEKYGDIYWKAGRADRELQVKAGKVWDLTIPPLGIAALAREGAAWQRAVEIDPDHAGAWSGLCWYYSRSDVKKYREATEACEKSISIDPAVLILDGSVLAYKTLGGAYRRLNQDDKAAAAYQAALAIRPNDKIAKGYLRDAKYRWAHRLIYDAPADWAMRPPTGSKLSIITYELPRAEGVLDEAELTVIHSPSEKDVQSVIASWANQFNMDSCRHCLAEIPTGANRCRHCGGKLEASDKGTTWKIQTDNLTFTVFEISGTRTYPVRRWWQHVIVAITNDSGCSYTIRATGPTKTIAQAKPQILRMIQSMRRP